MAGLVRPYIPYRHPKMEGAHQGGMKGRQSRKEGRKREGGRAGTIPGCDAREQLAGWTLICDMWLNLNLTPKSEPYSKTQQLLLFHGVRFCWLSWNRVIKGGETWSRCVMYTTLEHFFSDFYNFATFIKNKKHTGFTANISVNHQNSLREQDSFDDFRWILLNFLCVTFRMITLKSYGNF